MRAYACTDVPCSDKICFPQSHIKCGVAKSCLGTQTALQVPICDQIINNFVFAVTYTLLRDYMHNEPYQRVGRVSVGMTGIRNICNT